jgi:hypothetical protein
MKKKSNSTHERLFSPELKEVIKRLKRKEPELETVLDPLDQREGHREETETDRVEQGTHN